jgi:ATP-binding cassette subfamily B protein
MSVKPEKKKFSDQFSALRNVPRFFRMIWGVSPRLALWNIAFRLVQASMPLAILYVGKEIVDEVIHSINQPFQAR